MDPATATLVTTLGAQFLSSIFAPQQQGPSQAQILAMMEQQRRERESRNAWLIGGGLVAAGVVGYLLISRK